MIMIASASVVLSQQNFDQSYYYLKKQLFNGLLFGVVLGLLGYYIPYKFWRKISLILVATSTLLLLLVFVPGFSTDYSSANRWLALGPISFQPSEFTKIALIIFLAAWLDKQKEEIKYSYKKLLFFLLIVGAVVGPVLIQPDWGTAGLMCLIAVAMYFFAGGSLKHILAMVISGIALLIASVKIAPYRMQRLTVFFNKDFDVRGIGWQMHQSLIALGTGGWWGLGPGRSLQKFNYLPEPMGDSIFALIGEELGLIGTLAVLAFFVILSIRGIKIAQAAGDSFGRLMVLGIVSWFFLQAVINIGSMSGFLPLTGIPLPFISYGGSALAISGLAVGIILNVSKN